MLWRGLRKHSPEGGEAGKVGIGYWILASFALHFVKDVSTLRFAQDVISS